MAASGDAAAALAKLKAARARLVLDRPFLGALVLHLPLVVSRRCSTLATDGRRIEFDPGYVDRLTLRETQFMLAHQALHCALGHFARRAHRTRSRWDIACDLAVNQLLVDDGMEAPPGALVDPRYRGMSAEAIYPLVGEEAVRPMLDEHLFEGGGSSGVAASDGDMARHGSQRKDAQRDDAEAFGASDDAQWSDAAPHRRRQVGAEMQSAPPMTDPEDLARQWQMRLATASQQAERAGRLGASWQRVLGRLLQPNLPWGALLARYVSSRARDDYSFQRAPRREGAAILPRLHAAQLDLYVAIDTSGSVSAAQLDAFASEIEAIKGHVRARITLHACDERLVEGGPWVFEPWEPIRLPTALSGGAGTDFRPVFEWIREEHRRPDLLVYFTDAEGDFPEAAPTYPVIWLVKGPAPVPWGERIQLN